MVTSNTIHYAVQIDLSADTSDTDTDIGLYSGYFRWVTDRPDYDGVTVVPTGDNDGNIWKKGMFIDRKKIGSAIRMINIISSGDYGTLSGFNFKIDNTALNSTGVGNSFSDEILANDYFLINRQTKLYVIIDDVFYTTWTGIVTRTNHNELTFDIICEDNFKTIHKPLPPNTVTKRQFPNLASKDEGKIIPVCFGLVDNAKLVNISVIDKTININNWLGRTYRTAPIFDYNSGTKTVTIFTGNLFFETNVLADKYLKHIGDGDDQVLRIISNTESVQHSLTYDEGQTLVLYKCDIVLENTLTETPIEYPPDSDVFGSWVEIFDFNSVYLVSNDTIELFFKSDDKLLTKVNYWDTDLGEWVDISEIAEENSLLNIDSFGYPGIKVLSKVIDFDGNYFKISTITPENIEYIEKQRNNNALVHTETTNDFVIGGDNENIRSNTKTDYGDIITDVTNSSGGDLNGLFHYHFLMKFPNDLKIDSFNDVFCLADWDLESDRNHPDGSNAIYKRPQDAYKHIQDYIGVPAVLRTGGLTASTAVELRTIPGNHYNNGEANQTQFEDNKTNLSIVSWYDKPKIIRSYPNVEISMYNFVNTFPNGTTTEIKVRIYEICLGVERAINVTKEDVYTKVAGEVNFTESSDNIYIILRNILEIYDGIANADIDYNDLNANRYYWRAGRQLTERKNSKEYLQEIARQTFIGIYPTRKGLRALKAFRDDTDFSTVTHTTANGSIVVGSISKFEKSDINQVYNDFEIKYDWNPAGKRFEQSIYIHKANDPDAMGFPGRFESTDPTNDTNRTFATGTVNIRADGTSYITLTFGADPTWASKGLTCSIDDTSMGIGAIEFGTITRKTTTEIDIEFENTSNLADGATTTTTTVIEHATPLQFWKEYVGGYTDYGRASTLWTACNNSYTRTGRLNPLPKQLSECKWFIEESKFYDNSPGDNSTAHKYLDNLIEWTTRQKDIVEYKIPITSTNIALELLTPLTFNDQKYTGGSDRQGYITKIKINPGEDTISIEATLEPTDIDSVTDCFIQETGQSSTDIQESGSQPDDIQEGICT